MACLQSNGGNYKKTESETGVSRATLRAWAKSELNQSPAIATLKKEFADSYREKLKRAREAGLDRMLELIPEENDLHRLTGAVKVLSEISITEEVADDIRSTNNIHATSGPEAIETQGTSEKGAYN